LYDICLKNIGYYLLDKNLTILNIYLKIYHILIGFSILDIYYIFKNCTNGRRSKGFPEEIGELVQKRRRNNVKTHENLVALGLAFSEEEEEGGRSIALTHSPEEEECGRGYSREQHVP